MSGAAKGRSRGCLRAIFATSTRAAVAFFIVVLCGAVAHAQLPSVEFGSERFVKKFGDSRNPADQFVEFGLERETLKDWTKLVVFHHHPRSGNDPMRATADLAKVVMQRQQHADIRMLENSTKSEAMIHFLASAPGSDVVEVDVFKYARAADGDGLVSMQFAFRFTLGETDADDVKALRRRAVDEMASFPMTAVDAYFGGASGR